MIKCFICKIDIYVLKDFLKHFKSVHSLRETDEYKCMFLNCFRLYNSKNAFMKHLKNEHMKCENIENGDLIVNNESLGINYLFEEDVILEGFNLNGMICFTGRKNFFLFFFFRIGE